MGSNFNCWRVTYVHNTWRPRCFTNKISCQKAGIFSCWYVECAMWNNWQTHVRTSKHSRAASTLNCLPCCIVTELYGCYTFDVIIFLTIGRYILEDIKITKNGYWSSFHASAREVKQHWNAASTLKFPETKSCLPCCLLNSGKSFHPSRKQLAGWHELNGPSVSTDSCCTGVTDIDIISIFYLFARGRKFCSTAPASRADTATRRDSNIPTVLLSGKWLSCSQYCEH